MKNVYRGLTLLILCAAFVVPSFAAEVRTGTQGTGDWDFSGRLYYSCDNGNQDNGFFQDGVTVYGNAFDVGDGGPLTTVEFYHYAWGELAGPYDYNIYVYDALTCEELCVIGPLQAADAQNVHTLEVVDICPYNCYISGEILVGIQALSLSSAGYYHPTVDFEEEPVDNCMRQVDIASATGCDTVLDSGDFLLRITVNECTTPGEATSFSAVKAMYR